jgi:HlyD family secretion protein
LKKHFHGLFVRSAGAALPLPATRTHGRSFTRKTAALLLASLFLSAATGCGDDTLKGRVEATVISHYAETTGKILGISGEPGAYAEAGDALVLLDTGQLTFSLEQAEAARDVRQAALDDMLRGADAVALTGARGTVRLAEEALASAGITREKAAADAEIARELAAAGAISDEALKNALYLESSAEAAWNTAAVNLSNGRAALAALSDGATGERISMAVNELELAESVVRQCRDQIVKATVTAAVSGTIVSLNYLQGDVVVPGNNLVDIADDARRCVAVYWPTDGLASINVGDTLAVRAPDGNETSATVRYIDVSSEYTPKDEQSALNRNKKSVLVKLALPADTDLKPGTEVTVRMEAE